MSSTKRSPSRKRRARPPGRKPRPARDAKAELREALAQQAATSEILQVISRSRTDVQPVFEAIARKAFDLCRATHGAVYTFDGDLVHLAASHSVTSEAVESLRQIYPMPPSRGGASPRAILTRAIVYIPDIREDPEYRLHAVAQAIAYRSVLAVPMLHEGKPIGTVTVTGAEAGAFSERQIELLKTFADQAVIAIENVRLFTELQEKNQALTAAHARVTEALDEQTATSEVLRVISSSPTDVQPVFDAIVGSAVRLCEARYGAVFSFDGELLRLVAHYNLPEAVLEAVRRQYPVRPSRAVISGRAVLSAAVVQIPDVDLDPDINPNAARAGVRGLLAVPILRGGAPIGSIVIYRLEPGLFPDKQIELLKTFADQAIIAVENVRLFTELEEKNLALTQAHAQVTEALDQQTATSEILQVISSSPTDVQPVFQSILANAARLCEAHIAALFLWDGDALRMAAHKNASPTFAEYLARTPLRPGRQTATRRAALERRPVHIRDLWADPEFSPTPTEAAIDPLAVHERENIRTILSVPMLREGNLVGAITIWQREVKPFTDKQIELVKTFADQAAIAVENVRLFTELQEKNRALTVAHAQVTEALDQQTATSEILRVISRSPTDVQPVFDAIVESAVRLCEARYGAVFSFDGELVRLAAQYNLSETFLKDIHTEFPMRPTPTRISGRAILSGSVEQIPDVALDPVFGNARMAAREGFRSLLAVPILRGGAPIGSIVIYRPEAGSLPDKQVDLLKTFADQAVIAIENVRLFTELQQKNQALTVANTQVTEALDQQTATAEILRVISSSPTDVKPVFDAIAKSSVRLCEGRYCTVYRFDGELIHIAAHHNLGVEGRDEMQRAYPMRPSSTRSLTARAIDTRAVVHSPDYESDREVDEPTRQRARRIGYRSGIAVPMLRAGSPIGCITVTRSDAAGGPRPFMAKEVELLKTFADQAVIAIENVRLFQELDTRTRELGRSVEELQALGDVSRAVSSTLDLETVLNTIVARAVQLASANGGLIYEYDETKAEFNRISGAHLLDADLGEAIRAEPLHLGEGAAGTAAARGVPVQVPDVLAEGAYSVPRFRAIFERRGYRAVLAVPLLLERRTLGVLVVWRQGSGRFPAEVVNLLQTFASQSVLAIRNAQLYRELEEKGRQLAAASRHKSEFLANMSHELRTPLNAILGFNEMILGEIYGDVSPSMREPLTDIQNSGKHLLRLINNVLDLSKIEAGRMELSPADYSVQDMVERVRASLHPLAAEKGLEFVASVPADIPLAYGDGGRITQCLMNLAGNALKFTRQGRVEISVEVQGENLLYHVADTGIGIGKDKIDSLFTEFRQGDATITSEFGGTGLGLSITRKFVDMHGGRVWVESEPGKGSTFSFSVPLRLAGGKAA